MSYQLTIVTPNGKIFDGPVDMLMAPGKAGGFGVLGGHAPMLSALKPGALKVTHQQREDFFGIASGVLEVNQQHQVLILTNAAQSASNLDEAVSRSKEFENI